MESVFIFSFWFNAKKCGLYPRFKNAAIGYNHVFYKPSFYCATLGP